jgi:hypothetical protein
VTCSSTNGACCGVVVGLGLCCSRTLPRRELDFFDTGVSDLPLRLGVISLYDPFSLSLEEVSTVGSSGGDDICMARTDSGFRKRGRSFRGEHRASSGSSICAAGLDMEASEGMAETKL